MAPKKRPPIERFQEKTRRLPNGCIEWTAYVGDNGYGRFYVDGRGALAHRWAYEFSVGPIPEGLHLDHLCRNRSCVNVEHLEPVTPAENTRRGISAEVARLRFASITHCSAGHEYTEENTYRRGTTRACWTCKRERRRQHYLENREAYITKAADWRRANPERAKELDREAQARQRQKKKAS